MGKITTIYLTNEEAEELAKFCNENGCSQYSAMKTALKQLLSRPIEFTEISEQKNQEQSSDLEEGETLNEEDIRVREQGQRKRSLLVKLARELQKDRDQRVS